MKFTSKLLLVLFMENETCPDHHLHKNILEMHTQKIHNIFSNLKFQKMISEHMFQQGRAGLSKKRILSNFQILRYANIF